jgi:tRNA-splicing ligase RtcB (3'-phosphate/5'-hydroxy nucleic acid ligase)
MSFKYIVEQVSPNHYVLPKVGSMKVEAHAFLSEALYAASEEDMWKQIANGASYEGVIGAYLMPDCHSGYGIPVGSVIVTEDTLIQAGSGYDISCFTKDTKVSLVDGRELSFDELVTLYGEGGAFYVYSVTPEGRVTAGRAHSPRKTRSDAPLVEVELDTGEKLRCTPDHEWLLRDGSYIRADALLPGTSLMPLYRAYSDGYCNVMHPCDGAVERMYRVSFRETHGYAPEWPNVIHHDIFASDNPNPSKKNDDPRYLQEMDQKAHFELHAEFSRARATKSEIGWGRLHQLRPEQMSRMSSENMTRLHANPAFQERHAARMSATNRLCREAGKYDDNWKAAGQRGRPSLISYNQSEKGRERSSQNGLANAGRKHTDETRARMSFARKGITRPKVPCTFCGKLCGSGIGMSMHLKAAHNNHKVIAVRPLSASEDVYCLTVDKYHNFALSAGVFVHNCGVLFMKAKGLSAENVRSWEQREKWTAEVERRVATGVGSDRPARMPKFSSKKADEILRYGAKALGVRADLCERQFIEIPEDTDLTLIEKAYGKVIPQLGSVGGGNHFIELQVDRDDGSVWVMVHCGSRGYGWQTANHFFYEGARARGLPANRREDSWLRMDEQLGKDYWRYHNSAANFAVANRHIIVRGVQEALQETWNVDAEVFYEISHNLVQQETLVLPDGTSKKGFVHRKGATRAFPAGHPDLVGTKWETTGHPCCIPGSMYDGAAILYPLAGAYASACSVNHGSGRVLGRGAAKRQLEARQGEIDAEMREVKRTFGGVEIEGIVGNTKKTPLDECAHVYKDLDVVLDVLEAEGIARVAHRLYPVANLKGTD